MKKSKQELKDKEIEELKAKIASLDYYINSNKERGKLKRVKQLTEDKNILITMLNEIYEDI